MEYLGDKAILDNYKIGFLCSRKIPASAVLRCYDWAIEQREIGNCIISGFHSPLEREVLQILLKGSQPIIMILARGILQKIELPLKNCIERGQLLLISIFSKEIKRITKDTTLARNTELIQVADELVIGYSNTDGMISKLISEYGSVKKVKWLL